MLQNVGTYQRKINKLNAIEFDGIMSMLVHGERFDFLPNESPFLQKVLNYLTYQGEYDELGRQEKEPKWENELKLKIQILVKQPVHKFVSETNMAIMRHILFNEQQQSANDLTNNLLALKFILFYNK